jgi:hypothetical protein
MIALSRHQRKITVSVPAIRKDGPTISVEFIVRAMTD